MPGSQRPDEDDAALRHRIARVRHEAHDDSLDLTRIGVDGDAISGLDHRELASVSEHAFERSLESCHELVEVEDPRPREFALDRAREAVELARRHARPLSSPPLHAAARDDPTPSPRESCPSSRG